ncbi:Microtubule-associated protein futsch [Chionoecetes opilio]|uniref:Microtubule-associated protein futsch n=1 Tax=Chionoecetes opilio TaxID=41210 RepID=A0A8J4Y211_CHIOP|nr:Microtubule-associated protein futsch [Chionoecetes opilio]
MSHLESGSVVWVRLGQAWWPGSITTIAKCPPEFVQGLRKTPISIVKFFHENEYQDVHKAEHIFAYNCDRKEEFIRKGQVVNKNQSHGDVDLLAKFEADVVTAEKLTGGDMDILRTLVEGAGKRRIDYSDLGFGPSKPKKKREDGANRQGSDIGQAVVYKRLGGRGGGRGGHRVVVEHRVRIMEQPCRENLEDDMRAAASWYKCQQCGFTCTRLNVIVWHNKSHLSKVCNYDSGIKIPGRRRRRPGASRGGRDARKKGKERKGKENMDHAHTNGDVAAGDADDDYPPPQPRTERRPMPKAADINSAFDALLAASHTHSNLNTSSSSGPTNNYINNDSDSDYSDWEKYYARDSGSGSEDEEEVEQESDIKSLCESNSRDGGAVTMTTGEEEKVEEEARSMSHSQEEEPKQKQEEQEPEKMEAAPSPPRPVSVDRSSPPPLKAPVPCPALTPEPESDQQQEECVQPNSRDPGDLVEPPEKVEDTVEEVAEKMELEEGHSVPPDPPCDVEVTREVTPQAEEETPMATEEAECCDEAEKNSSEAMVSPPPKDPEVAKDCTEASQEDVKECVTSPVARDKEEQPVPAHASSRDSEGEQPENKNRLSRYIDEFSDTVAAKEEEVSAVTTESSRAPQPSVEAASSPRPLLPGPEGTVTASPARPGDAAATTTTSSGTTYMLVAVDAHGNTVPTVPTPALGEGGNDLVRVEATMEDGTTRTLYIDPAHLGPNVDLSNLMLHIDTSGQEHVIIPSAADSEGPASHPAPPVQCSPGHSQAPEDHESPSKLTQPTPTHVPQADSKQYKAYPPHCPPTSPRLDSNIMVVSGRPSQPPLASPCPAGVEFESRPQESLWPERVEAHTRLDCNSSKVRNPAHCQATSSDHQIALPSTNPPPPVPAFGRDTDKTYPHIVGTSVLTKHHSDNTAVKARYFSHLATAGFSQCIPVSLKDQVSKNVMTSPTTGILESRSGEMLLEEDDDDDEEEDEEEVEEDDSLNNEMISGSDKLVESVDEDSLMLDLEMEGEDDEPDLQQPVLGGESEGMESDSDDSDSDYLIESEEDQDGDLALLEPETENLVGSADDNEDSLMPDFEAMSEEEDEVSARTKQQLLSQSWETDDDSEEELYHNLPSASATDEEESGWLLHGKDTQNKGHEQTQAPNVTPLIGVTGSRRSFNIDEVEKFESPQEEETLCEEEKEGSRRSSISDEGEKFESPQEKETCQEEFCLEEKVEGSRRSSISGEGEKFESPQKKETFLEEKEGSRRSSISDEVENFESLQEKEESREESRRNSISDEIETFESPQGKETLSREKEEGSWRSSISDEGEKFESPQEKETLCLEEKEESEEGSWRSSISDEGEKFESPQEKETLCQEEKEGSRRSSISGEVEKFESPQEKKTLCLEESREGSRRNFNSDEREKFESLQQKETLCQEEKEGSRRSSFDDEVEKFEFPQEKETLSREESEEGSRRSSISDEVEKSASPQEKETLCLEGKEGSRRSSISYEGEKFESPQEKETCQEEFCLEEKGEGI